MMFSPYSECTDLDRKNQFMSTDFLLRYNFYSDFLVMYDNSMFYIFLKFHEPLEYDFVNLYEGKMCLFLQFCHQWRLSQYCCYA